MSGYRVVFAPQAAVHLTALFDYIAAAASPDIAENYTEAIVAYCESLAQFPLRGTVREDLRPGLRITHYRGRAVIPFSVTEQTVTILGVFYGGRDYESLLQQQDDAV